MPAVALTDHGSLAGAVELYREAASRASSRSSAARCTSPTTAPQAKGYAHLTLLAETNEGYGNLIKLSLARLPRGLLLQAARRLGAARAAREGHRRAVRAASRAGSARRSRRAGRRTPPPTSTGSRRSSAATRRYVEIQNAGLPEQERINPELAKLAAASRPAARGDRRRPLPAARGRARARGAALHPVGRLAEEPEPLEVRHRPVLLQDARPRWRRTSRATPTRSRARSRSPSAATSSSSSGQILLPQFPTPEGRDAFEYLAELARQGSRARYAQATPELRERLEFELKTIREMGFADYFLIVWDLIAFARAERHQRRPGPRIGRRLARRLLPRHHRRRPDEVRPPLRAVAQPRPQVDARHRHRLRRRRPRPGDQLRRREVRPRPRRADHHVRDDDGARRDPRRRPRARRALRHGRPDREARSRKGRRSTSRSR